MRAVDTLLVVKLKWLYMPELDFKNHNSCMANFFISVITHCCRSIDSISYDIYRYDFGE